MTEARAATVTGSRARARRRPVWGTIAERISMANYRPRLRTDLEWTRLTTRHGEPYTMLSSSEHYLRLSEEDAYLVQRMNGARPLSALVLDCVDRFGEMDFDEVAGLVEDLRDHAFLTDPPRDVYAELERRLHPPSPRRFRFAYGSALDIMVPLRRIDSFIGWMHDRVGWILFTRPLLAATTLIAVLGFIAAIIEIVRGHDPFAPIAGSSIAGIVALVVAYVVVTFVHESAHAVTCKHFGGRIPEGGFNLYYFTPGWYVDTSDAWLFPWYQRIAVSWAGPFSGFILAGSCCLAVWFLPSGLLATILFKVACVSYATDLLNLMPLLKLDGYYMLSDWLEIPNLRERALAFIAGPLWRALLIDREPLSRREILYTVFGLLSAVYSFLSIYLAFAWWGRRLRPIVDPLWRTPGLLAKVFAGLVIAAIFVPLAIALARRLWRYQRHVRRAPQAAKDAVQTILVRDRQHLLEDVAFLEDMPAAVAERLARAARVRSVLAGREVVRQGERGDEFFVIAEGSATVQLRSGGEDRVVGHYATGDFFGERALLGGGVRAASVIAETRLKLLVFTKEVFWAELAGPIGWQARVRAALEERQRLQTVPLFRGLGERQLDLLAVKLTTTPFRQGDVLVRQGDVGDAFYVIREGKVEVVRQEGRSRQLVATLTSGEYFGEMALLRDQPRVATVRAREPGSVWRLDRQDFHEIVARYLALEGRIARTARSRMPVGHARQSKR